MQNFNDLSLDTSLFETVFEQSYNSIVITDANIDLPGPKFIYVNKAFTKKTGYTLDDIKDKTPRILQGEKTNRDILDNLKKALINGDYFTGSTINYNKSGKEYYVEWNISPIKNKEGKIIYFVSIQKDITDKVLLEQKLKKEEEEKAIALKQVAMSEVLERIAHHWRQPLAIISAIASTIQIDYEISGNSEEFIKELMTSLDKIINQSKSLSETIDNFREISSLKDDVIGHINLKELIDDILKRYQNDIKEYEIDVVTNIDNQLVNINKNKLFQIILPLIDNSIYFLSQNNIKNRYINLDISIKEDNILFINIKDNAGGIDNNIIDKVFEPYFSTKNEKNYTGLGLYLVFSILENYFNGSIKLKNIENGLEVNVEIKL